MILEDPEGRTSGHRRGGGKLGHSLGSHCVASPSSGAENKAPHKDWQWSRPPSPFSPPWEHGAQNIPAPVYFDWRVTASCFHSELPAGAVLGRGCSGQGLDADPVLPDRPLCWGNPAGSLAREGNG